jgi:hypothetical protein
MRCGFDYLRVASPPRGTVHFLKPSRTKAGPGSLRHPTMKGIEL